MTCGFSISRVVRCCPLSFVLIILFSSFFSCFFLFSPLFLYFFILWIIEYLTAGQTGPVDSVPLVVMTSQFLFAQLWYLAYYLRCHCFRKYLTNTRKDGCTDWQIDRAKVWLKYLIVRFSFSALNLLVSSVFIGYSQVDYLPQLPLLLLLYPFAAAVVMVVFVVVALPLTICW